MKRCVMDDYLGAYALDALDGEEQEAVHAHLATCPQCAEEVECLAGTVSRLALLTLADVAQALPVPAAGGTDRRRIGRRALAAVAAVAACAANASGVVATHDAGQRPTAGSVVHASGHARDVTATLVVARLDALTTLHLSMHGVYPSGTCYLVAHARDGRTETAAKWVASGWGTARVDATTTIPPAELAEFDVVTASGHRVVRLVMARPAR
jgi:hypothetical protein